MDTRPRLGGTGFPYGSVLFPIYLEERLPAHNSLMRITWEKYSQLNNGCGLMMPALQSALQTQGTMMEQVFPGFTEANYSLAYQKQSDFRSVRIGSNGEALGPNPEPRALNDQILSVKGPIRTDGGQSIEHLGSTYVEFQNLFPQPAIGRALTVTVDLYVNNPSSDPVVKFWAINQYSPTVISKTITPYFQLAETITPTKHYTAKAGVPGFDSYQWVAMDLVNPQTSGSVMTYTYSAGVIPPAVIYAGANSKAFVSKDGGASWITYTFPSTLTVQAVTAVTNTQGLVGYVGASDLKLWKTTNGGQTFNPIYDFTPKAQGYISTSVIALIEVDPNNSNTVYVGLRGKELPGGYWDPPKGGLYKSTDSGASFGNDLLPHSTDNGWKECAIFSLAIDPRNSNVLYAGQDGYNNLPQEVTKSTDGGNTWTNLGAQMGLVNNGGPARVKISPVDSASIFVITGENQGHGIYHSPNGGTTWTRKAQPLGGQWGGFYGLVPFKTNKDNVTASGSEFLSHTVVRTIDGFLNWQTVNNTFGPNDLEGHWLAENVLYAPNASGVRWSFDGGYVWFDFPLDLTLDVSVVKP